MRKIIVILRGGIVIGANFLRADNDNRTDAEFLKSVRGEGVIFVLKNACLLGGKYSVGNLDYGMNCPYIEVLNAEVAAIAISR